jgi:DNA-binding PadR family transcriptional regulator
MSESDMSGQLPSAAVQILIALADSDRHGYGILRAVREQTDGRVPLRTGSLYRHLARLLDDGLVAEAPAPRRRDDPRRGVYYRLTPRGRAWLAEERTRLSTLVARLKALDLASRRGRA